MILRYNSSNCVCFVNEFSVERNGTEHITCNDVVGQVLRAMCHRSRVLRNRGCPFDYVHADALSFTLYAKLPRRFFFDVHSLLERFPLCIESGFTKVTRSLVNEHNAHKSIYHYSSSIAQPSTV